MWMTRGGWGGHTRTGLEGEVLSACLLQVGVTPLQVMTRRQCHPALYPVGKSQQAWHCGPLASVTLHVVLSGGTSVSEKGIPLCSQAREVRDMPQTTGQGSVPCPQRQVSPLHSHAVDTDGGSNPTGKCLGGTHMPPSPEFTVHMCAVPQGM